jgi:thiamine-phosphate pyrophosphorylase
MANICCDDVIFYTEGNPEGLYDLWEDLETYIILNQNPDLCWIGNLFSHKKIDSTGISLRGNVSYMEWNDTYILLSLETAWTPLYEAYQAIAAAYHVPFVINDNVDIALKIDADGVHVGQSDMETGKVREKLGPDKIIGVSCKTVEQALLAKKHGADYLGVGAIYPTGTKKDADAVTPGMLAKICQAVDIPVVAIGGLNKEHLELLKGTGVDGIAVVSALFAADDIEKAAEELKEAVKKVL